MKKVQKGDGTYTIEQKDMENEVLAFYNNLMGDNSKDLKVVDTSAM